MRPFQISESVNEMFDFVLVNIAMCRFEEMCIVWMVIDRGISFQRCCVL